MQSSFLKRISERKWFNDTYIFLLDCFEILLNVTFLQGCFSHFLSCTNSTKLSKALYILSELTRHSLLNVFSVASVVSFPFGTTAYYNILETQNFIEIALRHGCSTVNLLHIFRTPFPKNTSGRLLLRVADSALYGKIRFRVNSYSGIFYAVWRLLITDIPNIYLFGKKAISGFYYLFLIVKIKIVSIYIYILSYHIIQLAKYILHKKNEVFH